MCRALYSCSFLKLFTSFYPKATSKTYVLSFTEKHSGQDENNENIPAADVAEENQTPIKRKFPVLFSVSH
jgi:hypothetical protein